MNISDIEEGSSVSLLVSRDDMSVELPSEIVKVFDDSVLANCFMHDNSLISFHGGNLNIEMMVVKPGEVPYNFKNVQVTLVEYEGGRYHCLRTGTIGVRLNRRNAFRVFIGENGSVAELPGNKTVNVLVKDLSSTGIGFLISKNENVEFDIGARISVIFTDSAVGTKIEAEGKIVRIMEQETQMLYGCMFTRHYPAIERYTATKQLSKKNGKKKTPPKR